MSGLIGKKIGMTSIYDNSGKNVPCTILQVGPCIITQIKTEEKDGYSSFQLGFDDKIKESNKATQGHFKKSKSCLLYTSPSPRDATLSRMPSSA